MKICKFRRKQYADRLVISLLGREIFAYNKYKIVDTCIHKFIISHQFIFKINTETD